MSIINVVTTVISAVSDWEKAAGNAVSTESISRAKRLITRPIGVVSKKDIGACSTPIRIIKCSFRLAIYPDNFKVNCIVNVRIPSKNGKMNDKNNRDTLDYLERYQMLNKHSY